MLRDSTFNPESTVSITVIDMRTKQAYVEFSATVWIKSWSVEIVTVSWSSGTSARNQIIRCRSKRLPVALHCFVRTQKVDCSRLRSTTLTSLFWIAKRVKLFVNSAVIADALLTQRSVLTVVGWSQLQWMAPWRFGTFRHRIWSTTFRLSHRAFPCRCHRQATFWLRLTSIGSAFSRGRTSRCSRTCHLNRLTSQLMHRELIYRQPSRFAKLRNPMTTKKVTAPCPTINRHRKSIHVW